MNRKKAENGSAIPWYRKSKTNFSVCIIAIVLLVAVVVLILTLTVVLHQEKTTCLTPACVHTASTIFNYIDESVDPCHDFYQFACGNYLKTQNIPGDQIQISSHSMINNALEDQLKLIIDELLKKSVKKSYNLIKKVYNLCMNTTALEIEELPVLKTIVKALGGWPLLEGNTWSQGSFDWKDTMYKLRRLGFSPSRFISFTVDTDEKNVSRRMIHLDKAVLGMSGDYLSKGLDEELVKDYFNYMVDIAVLYGADYSTALIEFNKTFEFEIALAKLSSSVEDRRNLSILYNPMTVQDLQDRYPFINWKEYLNKIIDIPDINITDDKVVNVAVPKYFSELGVLLSDTPKRIQANYIISQVVSSAVYALPKKFRNRLNEYIKRISGQKEYPPRWKKCTSVVSERMTWAINHLYIRKYFNDKARSNAKEMVVDIQNEFINTLKATDWMDEETRQAAIEKASSILIYVGYADELLDENQIEKYYSILEINTNSYLKVMLEFSLFDRYNEYRELRESVNRTDWMKLTPPAVVNAFYAPDKNGIEFPAGILQGVFFDNSRPRFMNYGGIGYVIGHEVTHGFDDRGRQYDKDGNIAEWWTENTKEVFVQKAQCIVDQYKNYTVKEVKMNLNGVNTLGENIADNGGIKQAYLAYQAWTKRNGPEKSLPGLPYTPNQLFWISATNIWCSKSNNEYLKLIITLGSHPTAKYRVLGPLSNTDYFSKDFECPLGSKMNPVHKCQVW